MSKILRKVISTAGAPKAIGPYRYVCIFNTILNHPLHQNPKVLIRVLV